MDGWWSQLIGQLKHLQLKPEGILV